MLCFLAAIARSYLPYHCMCVQFLSLMLELLLWQKPCRSVSQEKGNSLAEKKISVERERGYKSSPHYHLQRFLQGCYAIELKQNQWHSHGTNMSPKAFLNFRVAPKLEFHPRRLLMTKWIELCSKKLLLAKAGEKKRLHFHLLFWGLNSRRDEVSSFPPLK